MTITRFAPSPSGRLHLGHALAALVAFDEARAGGGEMLLRIEDIDSTRCTPEFERELMDDLHWLGVRWPEPVRRQSEHLADYGAAMEVLRRQGLAYPCFCTRTDIQREIASASQAPHGPEGPLYPGTCRHLSTAERQDRLAQGLVPAWRLDAAAAAAVAGPLRWHDRRHGTFDVQPTLLGDVVLARKDISTSYHLAVVVDDALQGVTLVTRGEDLLPCSHVHRLLQALLSLPVPEWRHHPLVCDSDGRRLAKRHDAASLRSFREAGLTPADVRTRISPLLTA